MALARTSRSGTFTPANGSLLVVVAMFQRDNTAAWNVAGATAVSGGGLTWTRSLLYEVDEAYNNALVVWTAPVVTGASMSVTVPSPANTTGRVWNRIYEYTGQDSSPVGLTATGGTTATDGSFNPSLGSSPAASSEVVAVLSCTMDPAVINIVAGTGWTELNTNTEALWFSSQVQARSGSTTGSVLWDDLQGPGSTGPSTNGYRWAAIEIKALSGASPVLSAATVTNITGTTAKPRVTITF